MVQLSDLMEIKARILREPEMVICVLTRCEYTAKELRHSLQCSMELPDTLRPAELPDQAFKSSVYNFFRNDVLANGENYQAREQSIPARFRSLPKLEFAVYRGNSNFNIRRSYRKKIFQ